MMQGLSMVSRDGKPFYFTEWFSSFPQVRERKGQWVIAYLMLSELLFLQASLKQGIICLFVFQNFCVDFTWFAWPPPV